MKIMDFLDIVDKYKDCPQCGNATHIRGASRNTVELVCNHCSWAKQITVKGDKNVISGEGPKGDNNGKEGGQL